MNRIEWTESQRIELCAHIVPLLRSGLPIQGGLKALAADLPASLSRIASSIHSQLDSGQPLADVLGSGARPESLSLSATIAAGEMSGDLATAIERWASIHTARAQASKRFRYKLVYPIFLILISVLAIGYSMHILIPQYRSNLASLHVKIPAWFLPIELVHQNLIVWGVVVAVLCVSPILYLAWRRGTLDQQGWPRDPAYRTRLQAHATLIAEELIRGQVPLEHVELLAVRSLGVQPGSILHMESASRSILDLLRQGKLDSEKAGEMLRDTGRYLLDRSDLQIESQGRWIVYSVSIAVAIAVGLSYLLVVYLPWLYLLDQLKQIRLID